MPKTMLKRDRNILPFPNTSAFSDFSFPSPGLQSLKPIISFKNAPISNVEIAYLHKEGVTDMCGQILNPISTYQNKKKCPYQHVSRNI
jgi:hypothetical protein